MSPFPSRMFRGAAIYGVLVLAPLLLMPLPAVHPEVALGFTGVALVFQWVFWVISGDPMRYRALMLPAVAEKLVFAVPVLVFVAQGKTAPLLAPFAVIDLLLGAGFLLAFRITSDPPAAQAPGAPRSGDA